MAQIAFQTFTSQKQSLRNMLMCMASKGIFFHCEIHFKDGSVGFSGDKGRGVVLLNKSDKEYLPTEWIFYEIPCSASQEDKIKQYFVENTDKKYNWTGIFGSMITGLNIDSKKAEFCSEICFNALKSAGIINDFGLRASELSPSHLHVIIEKLGWKRNQY